MQRKAGAGLSGGGRFAAGGVRLVLLQLLLLEQVVRAEPK